jgi:hypothetical protein
MFKSWKTTSAGIASIVGGASTLYFAKAHLDAQTLTGAVTAILAGIGLLFARDNDKSSEEAGAK